MNCDTCQKRLSAWLDNELDPIEQREVEEHVAECKICQQVHSELVALDRQMRSLELPAMAPERVLRQVESIATSSPARPRESMWPRLAWVALSLAASLLLIVVYSLPDNSEPHELEQPVAVARLVHSTGDVQQYDQQSQSWQDVEINSKLLICAGTRLRTLVDSVCEIETTDQTSLRIGSSAEVLFVAPSHIQVIEGKLWSRVADQQSLRVDSPPPIKFEKDEPGPALFIMTCPSDSEFQLSVTEQESEIQALSQEGGHVEIESFRCSVGGNEKVCIKSNTDISREPVDPLAAKLWQLPLLATDQSHSELGGLLESMLIEMGRTKAGFMQEKRIRSLGPRGAIPLLAYVQSDRSRGQPAARHHAMRIAAEISDATALDRLSRLSRESDPQIAQLAQSAVKRIREEQQE